MLAPILASFLNACFNQGRLPACVSSALVTPIHKKGPAGDPANHRPIAVGEPLYGLYTIILNDSLGFMSRSAKRREQARENLHVSPGTAPSKWAKLCTYHHWFGRPSNLRFEPYYELPMGISKLRALMQFRLGSHALPIEQGRFARPAVPHHLRRCTVCDTQAVGDELHCVFDCPHLSDIRARFPGLFEDAAGCMGMFMWRKDQESVCHCLIALLQKAQT